MKSIITVDGLIALCKEHATKADNGAFTKEQLREYKRTGRERAQAVQGQFDRRRNELVAIVGGKVFVDTLVLIQIADINTIWFDRDEDGYLLLNVRMPSLSGHPRVRIEQNFWTIKPTVAEVICPPGGRSLEVKYANGDRFRVAFSVAKDLDDLSCRCPPGIQVGYLATEVESR